jgi:hypothetical protein
MWRRRLLIASAGVALLAVVVLTAFWQTGRLHGLWFRWTGSEMAFYQAMFRGTKNGDTRESLEALIGPGKTLDAAGQAHYARIMKKWEEEKHPDAPDGYRDGDIFVQYKTGGYLSCFQFRAGRLVNHDPAPFEKMQPFSALGK